MNKNDLQTILQGAFDAGILVDSGGKVLAANSAAVELFGMSTGIPGRFKNSLGPIASFLSIWSYSTLDATQGRKDIMEWKDMLQYVKKHPELAPDEWIVTCKQQDNSKSSFPGVLKLTLCNENLVLCYIRHKDKHQAMMMSGSDASSLAGSPQLRRGSFEKQAAAADTYENEPKVTVNAEGTILKFNQAAETSFEWCNNDIVGTKITEAAWRSKQQQPSMTVDENGIILNVNQAAIEQHAWCHSSLVGHHVSSIGSKDTLVEELQAPTTATADAPDVTPGMTDHHQRSSSSRSSGRWSSFRKQKSQQHVQPLNIIIQPTPHQGETIDINNDSKQQDTLTQTSDAQQRESILLAIFEASLDPLFQINEHGTIQMVNKAASTLFGWTTEEFLHNNISMICGGPHAQHHQQYMQHYLSTGDTRVMNTRRELPAKNKDGTEFPIELALVEVDTYLGEERLFCGFVRDLSNVKDEVRAQLRGH